MSAPEAGRYPTVTPYLLYEHVGAALAWLAQAFGFRERLRMADDDGTVNHAEMDVGADGVIMLGAPGSGYRNPQRLEGVTVLLHVYVDDIDAHFARAQAAGARILSEPVDKEYGDRRYDAVDLEGHGWSFAQPLRDARGE